MQNNYDKTSWVLMVLFIVGYGYFLWDFVTTDFTKPIVLIPVMLEFLWVWMALNEYVVIVHQPKIICKTGPTLTQGSAIKNLPGGKAQMEVWLKKRVFNNLVNKEQLVVLSKGLNGFFDMITGDIKILWTFDKNRLRNYTDFELSEGGYYYDGSFSGLKVETEHQELQATLQHTETLLARHNNVHEKMKSIVDIMGKSSDKNMLAASRQINLLMKDLKEASMPQQIQLPDQRQQIIKTLER